MGEARNVDAQPPAMGDQLLMRRPWLDELPDAPELPLGYALRACRPADETALAALLTRAFDDLWDEERVRRDLTEAADVARTYVVAYQGSVVATASARLVPQVYPGSGYVHWVGTDPAHGGKRLGLLATRQVLRHFRDTGLRDAVLETDDWRLPAVRTYLRLGFVPEYRDLDHPRRWARVLSQLLN